MSATKVTDQLLRESDSATASELQIGQQAPIHENKDEPSAANDRVAVHIVNDVPVMFDKTGKRWTPWTVQFQIDTGFDLPPEVKAAVDSGAMPLLEDDKADDEVDDSSSVYSDDDSSEAASLKSVESPSPKSEKGNSSLTNAFRPNIRKRLADKEQLGTETLTKRPKINQIQSGSVIPPNYHLTLARSLYTKVSER